jgi:hypothetical protein
MGFTDWTAPVQRGTAAQGAQRPVKRIAPGTYVRGGDDQGPMIAAAAIGAAVLAAAAAVLLSLRAKRRRGPVRRRQASVGPRA